MPWYRASLIGWRLLEQSKASKASNSTSSNVTALEQQLRDSEAKAVVAQELEVPSSADSDAVGVGMSWNLFQCESVRRCEVYMCNLD